MRTGGLAEVASPQKPRFQDQRLLFGGQIALFLTNARGTVLKITGADLFAGAAVKTAARLPLGQSARREKRGIHIGKNSGKKDEAAVFSRDQQSVIADTPQPCQSGGVPLVDGRMV